MLKEKIHNFLRKWQKYTLTDNVYLAGGGFWLVLSKVVIAAIYLTLGIVWARFVPKEVYGQYNFVLSIAAILAVFSLSGMQSVVVQTTAKGLEGTIKPILKTSLRWGSFALAAGFFLALYYWLQGEQTISVAFLIAGCFSPILNSFTLYTDYLSGKKRFDLREQYAIFRTFLAAFAIISAIFLTKNVIYLVLTYFSVNAILHTFFYFLSLKKLPPGQDIDPEAIKYGKHLSLLGIVGKFSEHIDKILIFSYLGPVQLAIYSFAVMGPSYIGSFTTGLRQLALPKFSVRDEEELKKAIWSKALRYGLFLMLGIVLYILLAEVLFKLLFPAYMESVFYSRIYALAVLGNITFLPRLFLVAKAKKKLLNIYTIGLNLTRMMILFVSVYFWGLLGIIVGQVVASFSLILLAFGLVYIYGRKA